MAAPSMRTLRVSLIDLELTPAGPGRTISGEVWVKLTKQVRTVDGQVVVLAAPRRTLDATGIVNFQVPANDDTGIAADDRGFGIKVGWDLTADGRGGGKVNVHNTGTIVLVTSASPAITLFANLAQAVVTDPLSTYLTSSSAAATFAPVAAAWRPLTVYKASQLVTSGGLIYSANADHTSGTPTITLANWTAVGGTTTTDASLLTAGTLADARLPVGSNAATIAAKALAADLTAEGVTARAAESANATNIATNATAITANTTSINTEATTARNASNLTSGTVANARLPVSAQAATLSSTYGRLTSVAVSVLDKGAIGDGVTDDTAAFLAALTTGRPVYVPGTKTTVYLVDDLSAAFINGSVMFGDATLRLRTAATGILYKTGISGFRLDGLTFDAADIGISGVRFIDCTDFDLGTTTYLNATYFGIDLQECLDFRAATLTANNNGATGGAVGSGVYLREKTSGSGCKYFDIGSIRGTSNGLGAGLDGATVHTSGSACTGSIGRIIARNNTRYGAKFQHTGGFVQVGQIIAAGNVNGVSTPAANGLSIGSIHADGSTGVGLWIDAACQNVHIGTAVILNSGYQGCLVAVGTTDLTIGDLFIRATGSTGTGVNGRGFDCRGVTRGKIDNLTITDGGGGTVNTSEALYVGVSDDIQFGNVTILDTRTGTARAATVGGIFNAAGKNYRIGNLRASNCQTSTISNLPNAIVGSMSIDGLRNSDDGAATILSGGTSIVVTHNLISTPTSVKVSGSTADTAQAYVSAVGATTLTITVPAAVGANRIVYWSAGIEQLTRP